MQFNNSEVCRTCLCLADNENVRLYSLCVVDNNNIDLKQKLKACIPELTMIFAVNEARICKACVEALNVSYNFRQMCLETERKVTSRYNEEFCKESKNDIVVIDCDLSSNTLPTDCISFNDGRIKPVECDLYSIRSPHDMYNASPTETTFSLTDVESDCVELNTCSLIVEPVTDEQLIQKACKEIPFLVERKFEPEHLFCEVRLHHLKVDNNIKQNDNEELLIPYSCEDVTACIDAFPVSQCTVCGKRFKTEMGLQQHRKRKHKYICNICDKPFTAIAQLKCHLLNIHSVSSNRRAKRKGGRFLSNKKRRLTIPTAKSKSPLQKNTMSSKNFIKSIWNEHSYAQALMLSQKPNEQKSNFECSTCSQVFPSRESLLSHLEDKYLGLPNMSIPENLFEYVIQSLSSKVADSTGNIEAISNQDFDSAKTGRTCNHTPDKLECPVSLEDVEISGLPQSKEKGIASPKQMMSGSDVSVPTAEHDMQPINQNKREPLQKRRSKTNMPYTTINQTRKRKPKNKTAVQKKQNQTNAKLTCGSNPFTELCNTNSFNPVETSVCRSPSNPRKHSSVDPGSKTKLKLAEFEQAKSTLRLLLTKKNNSYTSTIIVNRPSHINSIPTDRQKETMKYVKHTTDMLLQRLRENKNMPVLNKKNPSPVVNAQNQPKTDKNYFMPL